MRPWFLSRLLSPFFSLPLLPLTPRLSLRVSPFGRRHSIAAENIYQNQVIDHSYSPGFGNLEFLT